MSDSATRRSGRCLCGAVSFSVSVPRAKFSICHCSMCRRWSAGPFMAVHCKTDLEFADPEPVGWYESSAWAERGFCSRCGTSLFYRLSNSPEGMLAVSAEAFDDKDDLELKQHIYVDQQPSRYAFADDAPRLTEAEVLAKFGITPQGE
ncbi:MAG: hypothetical protein C0606_00205 [Hyphomicrobiales bacterium]|nr:MAG: hypothetical protein C0606_00205 [Hyphomicrobiales bacterium]